MVPMAVVGVMFGVDWGLTLARVDVVSAHDVATMTSDGVSMKNDDDP